MDSSETRANFMLPVLGSFLGWLMDGYVTISYLIQESSIVPLFFPGSLYIGYFFLFVVNGIARAIGAIYLGNFIGDRLGRQRMMVITILIFSLSSFSLAFLPTYAHIGVAAPVIMGILLCLMGLFAGAEYGGGTALSMESVPKERRNLIGAFVQSGFGIGYAILSFVYFLLTSYFGSHYIEIGWRILFMTTIIPGLSAFFIRTIVPESKVFESAVKKKEIEKVPFMSLLRERWQLILITLAISGGLLFVNAGTFSLYPVIFEAVNGFSGPTTGFWLTIINGISIAGVILGGAIAMRSLKRLPFMLVYTLAFIVVTVFVDLYLFSGDLSSIIVVCSLQVFFEAMIFSTLPAFLAESFSKRYRTTGVGSVYNIGSTFGSLSLVLIPFYAEAYGWKSTWLTIILIGAFVLLTGIVLGGKVSKASVEDEISQ